MSYNPAILAEYLAVREHLLAEFPELADDDQALTDTLDGETGLIDAIERMIRGARRDEAFEEACSALAAETRDRGKRFGQRAERRRAGVLALMQAAGIKKVERPDFTATIGNGRPKVIISDEAAIPQAFQKVTTSIDKTAISDALKAGNAVPGAELSNGGDVLTVRTR